MLKSIFSRPSPKKRRASTPEGATVYAIGDIHGRFDLLTSLLRLISGDITQSGADDVTLVFLGDYVDRGPRSRDVLDRLVKLQGDSQGRMIALKGNHEDAFLAFLEDPATGRLWAEHGGRETLLSYGVEIPRRRTDLDAWVVTRDALLKAAPAQHLEYLRSLQLSATIGDYMFVHAGVRPGVPLIDQEERDLLWIREDFLTSSRDLGKLIVHGHTPVDAPFLSPHRIGIDTGAYATGILTALKLRGEMTSFLQTGGSLECRIT